MTTLAEALATLDDVFQIGFVQSPRRDVFVQRDGAILTTHGEPVDLGFIYNLRLWQPEAEFHWWWNQEERDGHTWTTRDDQFEGHLDGQRLIRGAVRECDDGQGWSLVSDGHSRPLWVPLPAPLGSRIAVGVREYLASDHHGNVGVVAERLTQLRRL